MRTIDKLPNTWLTIINYSAGRQSEWLLESILRKELKVFLPYVLNANPGMENDESICRVESMRNRCGDAGIYFETVDGPNLYEDLTSGSCREHPPFFTAEGGKIGHHCTREYKIRPIRRAIRRILRSHFHYKGLSKKIVESWIGFSAEETHRVKDSQDSPDYEMQRYPLIELGVTVDDIWKDFQRWGAPMPKQSLCNGCFAHGLRSLAAMNNSEFSRAVEVDEAIRNNKFSGLSASALFVSSTRKPLTELQVKGFKLDDVRENENHQCDSGFCFT